MADIFDTITLEEKPKKKDIFDELTLGEAPTGGVPTGDIFDQVSQAPQVPSDMQRFGQAFQADPTVGAQVDIPVRPDQFKAVRTPVREEATPEEIAAQEISVAPETTGAFGVGLAKGLSPGQSIPAISTGIGGLVRMGEEAIFDESIIGKETADYWANELAGKQPELESRAEELGFGAGRSIGNNLPYLVAGAITKKPGIALAGLSGQVAGEKFHELREAGIGKGKSYLYAGIEGGAEALGEAVPVGILLKPGLTLTKRALLSTIADIPGELLTETIQAGVDTQTLNPEMTWGEFTDRLQSTAIQTAVTGPLQAGAIHPTLRQIERVEQLFDKKKMSKAELIEVTEEVQASEDLTPPEKENLLDVINKIPERQEQIDANIQERKVAEEKRLASKTFKPLEVSPNPLPESTAGLHPSVAETGQYYHTSLPDLQAYLNRHGDGFMYRATRSIGISEGLDVGRPEYKHRFKDKTAKVHSFTSSLDDALNFVANQSEKDYIIYRVLPEDISDDFSIQIPSMEGRGEAIHVQSPLPARTSLTDVIYRRGKLEGRSTDDSRRAIENRRVEGRQEGERGVQGLRPTPRREGRPDTEVPSPEVTPEGLVPPVVEEAPTAPPPTPPVPPTPTDEVADQKADFARSINLDKIKISPEAKEIARKVGVQKPKKVQSWDKTRVISKEIQKDYDKLQKVTSKVRKGEGLNAAEIDAVRQVNANTLNTLAELSNKTSIEDFNETLKSYDEAIFSVMSDASSEAGRALNIHKREISPQRVAKALTELDRGLNEREFKEFREIDWDNPQSVKLFVDRLGDPKLKDYFFEYWYNSILSGPPTHLVNTISNTAWTAYQLPHRGVVAGVDKLISKLTGRDRQTYLSEILPMMAGYKTGWFKGAEGFSEVLRTNNLKDYQSKFDREMEGPIAGAFERSPHKGLRKLAPIIGMPTRFLRAADVWANSVAFDGQMRALVRRDAIKKGYTGNKQKAYEKLLLSKPPKWLMEEASRFAKHATFMDDPGKFTQAILKAREAAPALRLILPFVNTISNLTKRGVELTPGLGLTLAKGQPSQEVIAKQIEGAIITLLIMSMVDEDKITGGLPKKAAEREAFYRQGKQPWSIKVGDTWYQYRRVEPFNLPISTIIAARENMLNAKDEEEATDIFLNTASSVKENVLDGSYLSGLSTLFSRNDRKLKEAPQRMAATLVPYSSFFRSINRAVEAGTEGSAKVRESSGFMNSLAQVLPGLSDLAEPRLNVWGEEIEFQGGMLRQWLPYKWSKEVTDDPLEQELESLNIYPAMPGQRVKIGDKLQAIPDDVYRDYVMSFGHKAKEILDRQIQNPGYQAQTPQNRARQIERIISKVRKVKLKELKQRMSKGVKATTIKPKGDIFDQLQEGR